MSALLIKAAADLIRRQLTNHSSAPVVAAEALHAAGMLQSPETAALAAEVESHRVAFSKAVGLGTDAPWDAITARVAEVTTEHGKVHDDLTGARLSLWEEEQDTARLRLALKSAQRGRRELRARLASIREGATDAVNAWIDSITGTAAPVDRSSAAAFDSLLDEYGRADTAPLGDMHELHMKLAAVRREAMAAAEARIAELKAHDADLHDQFTAALGVSGEWSDLVDAAATATAEETRADRLRARVAELEAERDAFRNQRNGVFADNEKFLARVDEAQQARLHAENETRKALHRVAELEAQAATARATVIAEVAEKTEARCLEYGVFGVGDFIRRLDERAADTTVPLPGSPAEPDEKCGRCKRPFDATDTRFNGHARHADTPWCRACIDNCHEGSAEHVCVICDPARYGIKAGEDK